MCGIIGYIGDLDAREVLIEGLSSLEYRGYDSAGIALTAATGLEPVQIWKAAGKVSRLKKLCRHDTGIRSHCGIGHTRWATHGGVTEANAHPHKAGKVTLIHNGIIENYHELQDVYHFGADLVSETDTEVAAKLLEHIYRENPGNPMAAIAGFLPLLEGSYAFCILFSDCPEEIYAVRNISPLIAADTGSGAIIASDLTALIPYTKTYTVVPEHTIVKMSRDAVDYYDLDGNPVLTETMAVTWSTAAARKNGCPHFMLKEIREQPEAITNTIRPYLRNELPDFSGAQIPDAVFKNCSRLQIVACGTAMHAGMAAKELFESVLRIPATVSIASEFRYSAPLIDEKTLVIAISQSGETIDTLAALTLARSTGAATLAVVNVKGSSIARESDYVLYTHAGPEIAVASTKAYSVQLTALYLICCRMALIHGKYNDAAANVFMEAMAGTAAAVDSMLGKSDEIQRMIRHITASGDAYYIGRGLDYSASLEGALKLKEISYIHVEACAAGELKHGSIALIEEGVPVIALATQDHVFRKTISNIREVKARGAFVIMIAKETAAIPAELCDVVIRIPDTEDAFTVFPAAVILQLIAYYAAVEKGLNVDQPRNLAKSVTVE